MNVTKTRPVGGATLSSVIPQNSADVTAAFRNSASVPHKLQVQHHTYWQARSHASGNNSENIL